MVHWLWVEEITDCDQRPSISTDERNIHANTLENQEKFARLRR
jgi:hypothetical protein